MHFEMENWAITKKEKYIFKCQVMQLLISQDGFGYKVVTLLGVSSSRF